MQATSQIEKRVAAALWFKQLKVRSNAAFLPLFFDEHRYLVLKGGGGSGKSIFAGQKILERVTSEPGHRWLVCRKVARTLRESCFRQLCGQLADYADSGYSINRTDMSIRFANGSEILFSGLDDVEKLKSIYSITGIWIEEATEITEQDFNQLDIRLRGQTAFYKQIILTFNPVSAMHWIKARFFDKADSRCRTHESTYKDNRYLLAEDIATLEGFRLTDEYYYTVYALGEWGVTGKTVFDARAITERLAQKIQPCKVGYFDFDYDGLTISNIRFVEDKSGYIKLYAEPVKGVPYVIGGDTAGDGSDSFVGQVLDNRTGVQVATLRHQFDEDQYAHQMYCLGMYYNTALVGIETNFSTYPNMELERLKYKRLYVRESIDDYTHAVKRAYGFQTNTKTRPVIISGLITAVREDVTILADAVTMGEMLTFVRGEDWKPQADTGAHDDCVIALAIAHYIRPQQSCIEAVEEKISRWTDTMREDYRNASRDERAKLRQMWGADGGN